MFKRLGVNQGGIVMKYILAIMKLILGIFEAILMFPIMLFTIPVQRYNEALYGKKHIAMRVRDLGDKLEIIMPNGEKIYASKSEVK